MDRMRPALRAILARLRLLGTARFFKAIIMMVVSGEFRRQEFQRRQTEQVALKRFLKFKTQVGDSLRINPNREKNAGKRVLIMGAYRLQEIEMVLIKGLELAGFEPVILMMEESHILRRYYKLIGIREIILWTNLFDLSEYLSTARHVVEQCRSIDDLLNFEYEGACVGRNAASTALRIVRRVSLDLSSNEDVMTISGEVARGMAFADSIHKVLEKVKPRLAVSIDTVYTGRGEFLDICLANGVDVIRWHPGHKSNTLMLKRYMLGNKKDDPHSLSAKSWQLVCSMDWDDVRRQQVLQELHDCYTKGDWYGENATQFGKRMVNPEDIRRRFGLNPEKRTAIIFPHIFWDASFTYGNDLFENYEDWFIKTVQAACTNDQINWIIKIHPANLGKNIVGAIYGEPAEVTSLRTHLGNLPAHIFMIPADSDISTYSLFALMDYCVTVRGTIGIEAAVRGIPALTAGTGRYDHKGFSLDSETREEYLGKIAHIQEIKPLSPSQRELAERYAYGLFILRPLPLTSITLEFQKENDPENYYTESRSKIKTHQEWQTASDLRVFEQWVRNSRDEDFINSKG